MVKITFLGAGSTIFAKNALGDCILTDALRDADFALYDIDSERLEESRMLLENINAYYNANKASIRTFLGTDQRRAALDGADFVINAIQVGGYEPSTVIDFEIPKKYGLRQTIGDTLGIGGIMRGIRTAPVMAEFAQDMEAVCPNAWLLNYTNPMSILTGFMLRSTNIKTVGLCHSVQVCVEDLLNSLDMGDRYPCRWKIAGINHMSWLLEVEKDGIDLYPEIKERAIAKNANGLHDDMVRFEMMRHFGYYITESSEHSAEYYPWFLNSNYPELIDRLNIPLDEYPKRCVQQIADWKEQKNALLGNGIVKHERSKEYASRIIEAIVTDCPYEIGGNILNRGLIDNLPYEACVEVPCIVNRNGIQGCKVGRLPEQLAALNRTHINVHFLVQQALETRKRDSLYQAAMLDPHTGTELSLDDIRSLVDDLLEAHGDMVQKFH